MSQVPGERARKGRARRQPFSVQLASSPALYQAARGAVLLVILSGMLLITWGVVASMIGSAGGLSALLAGGQQAGPAGNALAAEEGAGFLPIQLEADMAHEQAPLITVNLPQNLPTLTLGTPAPTETAAPAVAVAEASTPAPTATSAPTSTPEPSPTPVPAGPPDRIIIPIIGLDAPVVLAPMQTVQIGGQVFEQWSAPNTFAAGWQEGSAEAGAPGNTVINGHHNIDGEVFGQLYQLSRGDEIQVLSGEQVYRYAVSQVMKLEERDAGLRQRQENARWILPSTDERLTLVTCWPPLNNTYRLIVVAVPLK